MLTEHRPQKENRSPSPKKVQQHKLQLKEFKSYNEVPNASELHLFQPTQQQDTILEDLKGTERIQMKQVTILKAKLADKQFQARKLQEDFAEFKLLSRMQHEKTLKKLRDQLACSKAKHNQEIKKWQTNFQELTQRYQQDCELFKSKTEQLYRESKAKQLTQMQSKYEAKLYSLQEQLRLNQDRTNQLLNKVRSDYEDKIEQLKQSHLLQIKAQGEKHQVEIKKNEEICQIRVLQVVQAKEAEVRLAEESKQVTVKKQEKYLTQIGKLEREKKQVQDQLDQHQMNFKVLQKRYQDQANQIEKLKKQHCEELAALELKLSQLRLQTEQTIEADRLKVLKEHYEKTRALQQRLSELQQLRDAMISECKQNQRTLDLKFERRESRREDIEAIREIEYKLAEKERETSQLYYHLRLAKMQKENNDKIYTKIFTASKQKRGLSNRNDRDIYSLLKQSHTTDFRHLLKVTNKDSKEQKN